MSKSADAFRTISEVAEWLDTPAHVLRFWESKFTQVKPVKRAGGRRYYRPADMRLLGGIKQLLHEDGMTIKGVQKVLREQGIRHVSSLCALSLGDEDQGDLIDMDTIDLVPASEPVDTVVPFAKPDIDPHPEPGAAADAQVAAQTDPVPAPDEPDTSAETEQEPEPAGSDDAPPHETTEPDTSPASDTPNETPVQSLPDKADPMEEPDADPISDPVPESLTASALAPQEDHAIADAPEPAPEDAVVEAHLEDSAETSIEESSVGQSGDDPAALPGFLQHSLEDRFSEASPEAGVTDIEGPAPDVPLAAIEPVPTALTHLSRITRLTPDMARQIAPIVERLRALSR